MSLTGNASGGCVRGKINSLDVLTISAYGIAVKNGFQGTEEEWLESLKGGNGDSSQSGADGGYYKPIVMKTDDKTVGFWFTASQEDMPVVNPVFVTLPAGADGKDGADGGYYIPYVRQPDSETVEIGFGRSKPDLPEVKPTPVTLPAGPKGDNYVLTEDDRNEIAVLAAELVDTDLLDIIGTGVIA